MNVDSKINEPFKELATTWQMWLAVASAYIYAVGYIKGYAFLTGLGEDLVPTVIYTPGSLFSWGLISVLGGSLVPILLLLACLALARAIWPIYSGWIKRVLFGILSALLFLLLWKMLFGLGKYHLFGYLAQVVEISPTRGIYFEHRNAMIIFYVFLLYALSIIALKDFRSERYRRPLLVTLVILSVWCPVGTAYNEFYSARHLNQKGYCAIAQRPTMYGSLITNTKIHPDSSHVRWNDNNVYATDGLLLNKLNNAYYLYIGYFSHHEMKAVKKRGKHIVVVPEQRVISFINKFGVAGEMLIQPTQKAARLISGVGQ